MFSSFENDTVYKIGDSFTMRNILNIVDKMNATIPYHEFEPECISEGGICEKVDPEKSTRVFVFVLKTGLGFRVVSKKKTLKGN